LFETTPVDQLLQRDPLLANERDSQNQLTLFDF
jgi:hypothetical protein